MGHVGKTVTQNVVSGSEITDGTVTGDDLASDIAISTSGAITTTGAFTSKGIDDNADATAITIDSSENVGIANTSPLLKLDVTGSNTAPASSGTSQSGSLRLGQTAGNGVVDMGFDTVNTQGWIQATNKANLATNYTLTLNPNGGIVTKPQNPHFIGGRQGTTGSVTGYTQGSGQNMIANIEQDDTGGHYNNTNGEFTCPATGVYQVNFHGFLHSGSGNPSSNYSIQIHLNASIMQYAYFGHVQGTNTYMSYSTSIRAAATNILTVKLMNGLWYSNDWRYFGKSICLLG